jgi:hypothetical protein
MFKSNNILTVFCSIIRKVRILKLTSLRGRCTCISAPRYPAVPRNPFPFPILSPTSDTASIRTQYFRTQRIAPRRLQNAPYGMNYPILQPVSLSWSYRRMSKDPKCQSTWSHLAIWLLNKLNGLCPMGKKPPRAALEIVLIQSCRYSESSSNP